MPTDQNIKDQKFYPTLSRIPVQQQKSGEKSLHPFSSGFTMIELVVSVAIIGVLTAMVVPTFEIFLNRAKVGRALQEVRVLETEIHGYSFINGEIPLTLADINRGDLMDPWGELYVYNDFRDIGVDPPRSSFGIPLNTDFDVYSKGKDRVTDPVVSSATGKDDVMRGAEGVFVGLGEEW